MALNNHIPWEPSLKAKIIITVVVALLVVVPIAISNCQNPTCSNPLLWQRFFYLNTCAMAGEGGHSGGGVP